MQNQYLSFLYPIQVCKERSSRNCKQRTSNDLNWDVRLFHINKCGSATSLKQILVKVCYGAANLMLSCLNGLQRKREFLCFLARKHINECFIAPAQAKPVVQHLNLNVLQSPCAFIGHNYYCADVLSLNYFLLRNLHKCLYLYFRLPDYDIWPV